MPHGVPGSTGVVQPKQAAVITHSATWPDSLGGEAGSQRRTGRDLRASLDRLVRSGFRRRLGCCPRIPIGETHGHNGFLRT
jgi:hypothetical protein